MLNVRIMHEWCRYSSISLLNMWTRARSAGAAGKNVDPGRTAVGTDFHGSAIETILEDQKGIYFAPFEPAHIKYDAIVLGVRSYTDWKRPRPQLP